MADKKFEKLKAIFLVQLFLLLILGCGDAGNDNGIVRGTVYSNIAGGSLGKTPEPGVSAVAVFEGSPERIRTAVTDQSGQYVFSGLPIGKWKLGFVKDGFVPVTTESGNSRQQTAVGGNTVIVYVETGATVTAPDVTLSAKPAEGDGTVIVTLIDKSTGERINGATVVAGTSSTSNSSNGQYVLTVSVKAPVEGTVPSPIPISISVAGYNEASGNVTALAGQTVEKTIELTPKTGILEGQIRFARFETLYDYAKVTISVDGLDLGSYGGTVDIQGTGQFKIPVPVRTDQNQRSYTLRIRAKGFNEQVVNNVLAPVAGSVTVNVPSMVPKTVTVLGQVINPFTQINAVIKGIGLEGGVSGGTPVCGGTVGTFSIDGVPTDTESELTVKVKTYSLDENCEKMTTKDAEATFTATSNDTGVYRIEPIGGSN